MSIRSQTNPELASINLSFKLLTTLSSQSTQYRSSIPTLQELSNRLTIANQYYANKKHQTQLKKQQSLENNVNLNKVREIAQQVKNKRLVKQQKNEIQTWELFQYKELNRNTGKQYLQQSELRIAHYSIVNSFSNSKPTKHMNTLIKKLNYANSGQRQSQTIHQQDQFQNDDYSNLVSQFINKYLQIMNEGQLQQIDEFVSLSLENKQFIFQSILSQQIKAKNSNNKEEIRRTVLKSSLNIFEGMNQDKNFWRDYQRFIDKKFISGTPSNIDTQLHQNLNTILHQISNGEQISIKSNIIKPDSRDSKFMRVLKCITNGKYERCLFNEGEIIPQAWMIILTLGLRRKNRERYSQQKQFKKVVKSFTEFCKQILLQNPNKIDLYDQVLSIFLGLGSYVQIVNIYKCLNARQTLQSFLAIQVFIVLVVNYELIDSFNSSKQKQVFSLQTKSIIKEMIVQICIFACQFKKTNQLSYCYFIIIILYILRILNNIQQQMQQLPLQLDKLFDINISHLETINCKYLSIVLHENNLGKQLLQRLIAKIKIQSNEQFTQLAQLCKQIMPDSFLKFILIQQIQLQREGEQVQQTIKTSLQSQLLKIDSDVLRKVKQKLYEVFSNENKIIINFLAAFYQLKEKIRFKKHNQIMVKKNAYQRYLEDYGLLNSFEQLSQRSNFTFFDLYISYYEQMSKMYKTIISKNSVQLKKMYLQLSKQLNSLQNRYRHMNGQRLNKLLAQLSH